MIGRLGNSPAAAPDISTSDEDSARLGYEAGDSAFMVNYTFAYGSAGENAPDIQKKTGVARYPEVDPGHAQPPAARRLQHRRQLLLQPPRPGLPGRRLHHLAKSQLPATKLDGLPPSHQDLYTDPVVTEAFPGFAPLVKQSLDDAAPRPLTPAYTDLSLGDPADPAPAGQDRPRRPGVGSTTSCASTPRTR